MRLGRKDDLPPRDPEPVRDVSGLDVHYILAERRVFARDDREAVNRIAYAAGLNGVPFTRDDWGIHFTREDADVLVAAMQAEHDAQVMREVEPFMEPGQRPGLGLTPQEMQNFLGNAANPAEALNAMRLSGVVSPEDLSLRKSRDDAFWNQGGGRLPERMQGDPKGPDTTKRAGKNQWPREWADGSTYYPDGTPVE